MSYVLTGGGRVKTNMNKPKETNKEVIKKWKDGVNIWSISLGGIGPGYEQAIQVLLFEIMAAWGDRKVKDNGRDYPEDYANVADIVARELKLGFSGAQVGAAKATAYKFIKYGYAKSMESCPDDRMILVSRNFP